MSESVTRQERMAVSPKLRFEIFKRDKFTCQYCGQGAPEVVLHCDHIVAVANGGSSDILNLITSCSTCNGGKGATPLSDSAVIDKQRRMLEELEERRQQLEMLVQWRDELRALKESEVDLVSRHIADRATYYPNENGQAAIRRWLKRYTLAEIFAAIDEAFDLYIQHAKDGSIEAASWERAFSKVSIMASIARNEKDHPNLRRILYIQGILRNRAKIPWLQCVGYLDHVVENGANLEEVEHRAKTCDSVEFRDFYDSWLASIGRPF